VTNIVLEKSKKRFFLKQGRGELRDRFRQGKTFPEGRQNNERGFLMTVVGRKGTARRKQGRLRKKKREGEKERGTKTRRGKEQNKSHAELTERDGVICRKKGPLKSRPL